MANGQAQQTLMAALVEDCNRLYTTGLEASLNSYRLKFHEVYRFGKVFAGL